MADNVFELLKAEYPQLIIKLDSNHDLCAFLMSAYAHLLQIAIDSPNDPKNLMCFPTIEGERLLVIRCKFYKAVARSAPIGDKQPAKRNLNLVRLLQVSPSVRGLALNVVNLLDRWVEEQPYRKQAGFENIKTFNAILHREHVFTTELILKVQFDEFVANKLNWEAEPPATDLIQ